MDANRLRGLPLFASLSHDERERVAQWADEVEVEAGKHLVNEGEFAYEFFVIEEGNADVLHEGEKLSELSAGDYFGEIALLETERRTASVVATTPMRLVVMFGRDFREMASEMPHVADSIRKVLEERKRH